MLSEKANSKMAKWRKDAATRQREFKDGQRKLGRRRAEYWVTDDERRELDEMLARQRSST